MIGRVALTRAGGGRGRGRGAREERKNRGQLGAREGDELQKSRSFRGAYLSLSLSLSLLCPNNRFYKNRRVSPSSSSSSSSSASPTSGASSFFLFLPFLFFFFPFPYKLVCVRACFSVRITSHEEVPGTVRTGQFVYRILFYKTPARNSLDSKPRASKRGADC